MDNEPKYYDDSGEPTDDARIMADDYSFRVQRELARLQRERDEALSTIATLRAQIARMKGEREAVKTTLQEPVRYSYPDGEMEGRVDNRPDIIRRALAAMANPREGEG